MTQSWSVLSQLFLVITLVAFGIFWIALTRPLETKATHHEMLEAFLQRDNQQVSPLRPPVGEAILDKHQASSLGPEVEAAPEWSQHLKVPLPVIVVGFPKSGTTSVHKFFKCSGVHSQHFCCCGDTNDHPPCDGKTMTQCVMKNMAEGRKLLQGCGSYQVYCQIDGERPIQRKRDPPGRNRNGVLLEDGTLQLYDVKKPTERQKMFRHFLPQHFYLDRLHQDYPTATYVLPLRDPAAWSNSVMNWFQMRGRMVNEYIAFNSSIERPGKERAPKFLENIYEQHTRYIRQFVKEHPEHLLVEVNISDSEAGNIMADAFGLDPTCWGHHNKLGNRPNNKGRTGAPVLVGAN